MLLYTYRNLARLYAVLHSPAYPIDVRLAAGVLLVYYLEMVAGSSSVGGGGRQFLGEEE